MPNKPSFLSTVASGIWGYIKGGFVGMAIGAVVVGAIAAAVGVFAPQAGYSMLQAVFQGSAKSIFTALGGKFLTSVPAALNVMVPLANPIPVISHATGAAIAGLSGAVLGGSVFAGLGSLAGTFTAVKGRMDEGQPSAGSLVNALNMAHQHGEMVGQQQVVQQLMAAEQAHGTKWQDRHKQQAAKQAAAAIAGASVSTVVH